MEVKITASPDEMALEASRWVQAQVEAGVKDFFLPAGESPRPLYELWRHDKPNYLRGLRFTQIDEISSGAQLGKFEEFFRNELGPLAQNMHWVREIPNAAEAAVLGFGTNGHVAFHEPHLPVDFRFGTVTLSPETVKKLGLEAGATGLSFGLGTFIECRALLLLVSGPGKNEAFRAFMSADAAGVPASRLKLHKALTVIVDRSSVDTGT